MFEPLKSTVGFNIVHSLYKRCLFCFLLKAKYAVYQRFLTYWQQIESNVCAELYPSKRPLLLHGASMLPDRAEFVVCSIISLALSFWMKHLVIGQLQKLLNPRLFIGQRLEVRLSLVSFWDQQGRHLPNEP